MMINHELKPRNAKENPARALCVAVFAMCIVSGLLLLILAFVLYTMEPAESVIRIGVVAVYVVAGLVGGVLAGKLMREQKFLWGLAAGGIYFALLFLFSVLMKGGIDTEPVKLITTLILCGAAGMAGGMVS